MVAGLSLLILVLAAFAAGRWGAVGAVGLAVASVLWLWASRPVEGRVLIEVTTQHGLAAADLGGLAGLVMAGVILWRAGGGP